MTTKPQPIHYCDWAGQPDIHILCDNRWTSPEWDQPQGPAPYLDTHGKLYAFDISIVTCKACLVAEDAKFYAKGD